MGRTRGLKNHWPGHAGVRPRASEARLLVRSHPVHLFGQSSRAWKLSHSAVAAVRAPFPDLRTAAAHRLTRKLGPTLVVRENPRTLPRSFNHDAHEFPQKADHGRVASDLCRGLPRL